jgi:hypothetical protein
VTEVPQFLLNYEGTFYFSLAYFEFESIFVVINYRATFGNPVLLFLSL